MQLLFSPQDEWKNDLNAVYLDSFCSLSSVLPNKFQRHTLYGEASQLIMHRK